MTRLKRKKDLPGKHPDDVRFGTPQEAAEYRAERMCGGVNTIVEVGAGAGFQTRSFATRVDKVIAIDIDADRLARAEFPHNAIAIAGDALDPAIIEQARQESKGRIAVFLDPERPATSRERRIAEVRPDLNTFLNSYRPLTEDIAIELPPFLDDIPWECEREYLSIDGELNRLTVYFGRLRKCDVSIVNLTSGERLEHTGPIPQVEGSSLTNPPFLLEPDKALAHAGLAARALPERYKIIDIGNGQIFLTQEHTRSSFFRTYRVISSGTLAAIKEHIGRFGRAILHGAMSPEEQRSRLAELNALCNGDGTVHIFIGDAMYACEKMQ